MLARAVVIDGAFACASISAPMLFLSRRQFVEHAVLTAGAALCPSALRASNSSSVSAELAAGLGDRATRARHRIATVARFLDEAYPQLRRETIAAADEALRGELLLPGNRALSFVGDPPDWFTPRYGDEEYLWSLNRMMHWKTLLRAHALTGEEHYAAKVVDELDDWIARARAPHFRHDDGTPNPHAVSNAGPPPWRSLEIGIRMFDTWPVVVEHLAGTAHLPPARLARLAESVTQHAEALSLLTPLLWPDADHNHYFMEMLGLLSIGVRYRELPGAASLTNQAIHELQRCVRRQFTTDGGHVEGCPSYHNLCVVFLARFLSLAAIAQRELPADIHQIAATSIEQTLHSTRPTGTIVPWGDSTQPENFAEAAVWFYKGSNDASVLQHLAALTGLEKLQSLCAPFLWEIDDPADLFARMAN
ncbi:MAG TPA: heparinase II/III family protein, partial [Opitutus sp.]|nr:heparinase II/III family protein [Opitutus sp.]